MIKKLTEQEKKEIYDEVREFLAEELEKDLDEIKPESNIINDLEGDSLLYLELIEEFKKKYQFDVEVRVLGQYFQKNPVYTVEETVNAIYEIMERGDELIEELKGATLEGIEENKD